MPVVLTVASCSGPPAGVPGSKFLDDGGRDVKGSTGTASPLHRTKASMGPSQLSVRDNKARTNNAVESFHAAFRGRVKVSHPNMYTFFGQLQWTTTDVEAELERTSRCLAIRRAKNALMSSTMHDIWHRRLHTTAVLACRQSQCGCTQQRPVSTRCRFILREQCWPQCRSGEWRPTDATTGHAISCWARQQLWSLSDEESPPATGACVVTVKRASAFPRVVCCEGCRGKLWLGNWTVNVCFIMHAMSTNTEPANLWYLS